MFAVVPATLAARVAPRYTSYPVTPTLSVDAVQFRVNPLLVMALAARPNGAEGGVVSPTGAEVVTGSAADWAEAFPAASLARTVTEYAVDAVRPVMLAVVPAVDVFSTEFRYTS